MTEVSVSPPLRETIQFTVLLVDDDPVTRGLMAMVLSRNGHEVLQCNNGEEALELIESNSNRPIHLLVTDIIMPRIGGNELASRLQALYPEIRVLFCSGHPQELVLQEHIDNKKVRFLRKPFPVSALLEHVDAALDRNLNTQS